MAWWGEGVDYGAALERQRARRELVIAGDAPELLALLEHPPVVTFGRREAPGNPPEEQLRAAGLATYRTERGGLATWHGPGQLVGYLILDRRRRGLGVPGLVCRVEAGIIDWLEGWGVSAGRRPGLPGVWVGQDKIAAIGLHFRAGVSMHGFSLNLRVAPDSQPPIVPCGVRDGGLTSLHLHASDAPAPAGAWRGVAEELLRALTPPAR